MIASIALVAAGAVAQWSMGLKATYFLDAHWQHPAYATIDRRIDIDSLTGNAPVSPDQPFSVRWFGYLHVPRPARYAFTLNAAGTGGMQIEQGATNGPRNFDVVTDALDLQRGAHPIAVSYSHERGRYGIDLKMSIDGGPWTTIPSTDLAPRLRSTFAFRAMAALVWTGWTIVGLWLAAAAYVLLRRVSTRSAVTLASATSLFALAVTYDVPSWIRGPVPYPQGWQWSYHGGGAWFRLGPAAMGAAGIVAAIAFLSSGDDRINPTRRGRIGLLVAMLSALLFDAGVLHLGQGGAAATVAALTRSDLFTGYFGVAADRIGTTTLLANYSQMLEELPVHARTHPPGPVLYYKTVINSFEAAPSAAGSLVQTLEQAGVPVNRFAGNRRGDTAPVLAAAAVVAGAGTLIAAVLICWAVARIASAAGADPRNAAAAGALWALCPASVFFLPTFDVVGAFLIAAAVVCGCQAVATSRTGRATVLALAAGALSGAALFCSFGAAPMLVAGGITVLLTRSTPPDRKRLAILAVCAAVGTMMVFAIPILLGFDLIGTMRGAMHLHRDHYTPPGRALWLRFNLLDFANFLGWPLLVWLALIAVRTRDWWAGRLVLALAATVVLIDIADVTRSEVGRLWMPLMPLAFAGTGVAASTAKTARAEWVLVAVLLSVTSLTMALHWAP